MNREKHKALKVAFTVFFLAVGGVFLLMLLFFVAGVALYPDDFLPR